MFAHQFVQIVARLLVAIVIAASSLPTSFLFGPPLGTQADESVHVQGTVNVGNINIGNLVIGTIHNNTTSINSSYSYGVTQGCLTVIAAIATANGSTTATGLSAYVNTVGSGNFPTCLQLLTANLSSPSAWVYTASAEGLGNTFASPTAINGYNPATVARANNSAINSTITNTLTPRGTQSYPVSANNGSGTTYVGNAVLNVYDGATTVASSVDVTPPAAPTSASATDAASGGQINLAWTNPSDGDFHHINIYRSTGSGTLGSIITSTSSPSTASYANTGLTNGTTYYYTLRSVDATGNESTNTGQVSATPSGGGGGGGAPTTGTFKGKIQGPHGEVSAVSYSLKNNSTGVTTTGTTAADGSFTATLDASTTYSLTVTPDTSKSGFSYAGPITLPYVGVAAGGTVDAGAIYLRNQAGQADADVDSHSMTLPNQCNTTPAAGAPVINRVRYQDQKKDTFLYQGNSANVVVYADQAGYTVTVDYSILEGQTPGTTIVSATDNGDGTYTAVHTLSRSSTGGGLATVSVSNGSNQITTDCTSPGPVNLDIRSFFTGSDTSNFPALAADPATDFHALTNFTMHQNGVVKITFTKSVNMLDPTVQNFMQAIAKKLVAKAADLTLDAKAAVELEKTGATITMYGLPHYTSTPTILVNGTVADSSTVSGISYDSGVNTLTFAAAHFSQYQAVPTITVTAPTDGITVSTDTTTVNGTVNDPAATVHVTVGGTDQGTVTVASDGSFSKSVSLATGSNSLVISASNNVGSATSVTRSITRSTATATTTSSTVLPKTGANLSRDPWPQPLALALGLLGSGWLARRRYLMWLARQLY